MTIVSDRFQPPVSGALLAAVVGWVLYIGKEVFIPIILGALVALSLIHI